MAGKGNKITVAADSREGGYPAIAVATVVAVAVIAPPDSAGEATAVAGAVSWTQ